MYTLQLLPHVGQLDKPFRTVLLPVEHCIDFMMISDVRHETVIGEDAVADVAGIHAAVIQMTGPPGPGTGGHTAAGRGWQVAGPVLPRAQAVNSPQVGSTTARESFEKGPVTSGTISMHMRSRYKQNVYKLCNVKFVNTDIKIKSGSDQKIRTESKCAIFA